MYISTFNGAMQANGHGGYAFKTIDPYLDAGKTVLDFCHHMADAAACWFAARHAQ